METGMNDNIVDIYSKYKQLNDKDKINFVINLFCGIDVLANEPIIAGGDMDSHDNLELVDLIFDNDFLIITSNNKTASRLIKERLLIDGVMLIKVNDKRIKKHYKTKYKSSSVKYYDIYRNIGQTQPICDN